MLAHGLSQLWLCAGLVPWGHLATPMQVIYMVGVLKERLPIPPSCPPPLARLLRSCWQHEPDMRPSFADIRQVLQVCKLVCIERCQHACRDCIPWRCTTTARLQWACMSFAWCDSCNRGR